ncbi:hypothetical protein D3C83_108140 [compost metagenome]
MTAMARTSHASFFGVHPNPFMASPQFDAQSAYAIEPPPAERRDFGNAFQDFEMQQGVNIADNPLASLRALHRTRHVS